ncbi:MAG: biopolymer transporter ExbD [Thermovirgaceae bacterium]
MRRARARRNLLEVELTPLVDVLFMLIIFFVLTAVFSEPLLPVNLPGATGERFSGKSFTISIDRDGGLFSEGGALTKEQAIERALASFREGKRIIVAADREVRYGFVVSFLDALRSAGVDSAGLLVDPGAEQ